MMRTSKVLLALALGLVLAGCFGGDSGPSRKQLADLNKPFLLLDDAYHWSEKDPAELCAKVAQAGGHGIGIELGELMNSGPGGPVTDFKGHYRTQIDHALPLIKAADRAKLWVKVIFLNSNAKVCKSLSKADAVEMFDLAASKFNRANVLMLIVSEYGHGGTILSYSRRAEIMAYGRAHWPVDRLVVMDDDGRPYRSRETHLSRFNFDLVGKQPIIAVTDNNVTLSDGLSVGQVSQLATRAVAQKVSFELYGKEKQVNMDKWKAAGKAFAGVNN